MGGQFKRNQVECSPPDRYSGLLYINKRTGDSFGESSTATSTVYITITLNDQAGSSMLISCADNSSG